jgi:hypothetical protein
LGTVFSDRRFYAAVSAVLVIFFAVPEDKATPYLETIGTLISTLALMISWTLRPPSGLKYKEILDYTVISDIAKKLNLVYGKKDA